MLTYEKLKKLKDVKVKHVIVTAASSILLTLAIKWWFNRSTDDSSLGNMVCFKDYINGGAIVCRPKCKPGYYSMPWMDECEKHLSCNEIQSFAHKATDVIGGGAVKGVHQSKWKGYDVAYNILQNPNYVKDFKYGMGMLRQFQSDNKVTQLLGYCKNTFVTELHSLGDASKFITLIESRLYGHLNTLSIRFKLCISYVEIIRYFHNHEKGTYVFCDSNTLIDTLKQYLITPSFTLVANDLDALPLLKKGEKMICGHRPLWGEFVAPEQRWDGTVENYRDDLMPGYDEKIDIWKIPEVCMHFLGNSSGSDGIKFRLFKIHNKCKDESPKHRPTADEVLQEYRKVQYELVL